MMRLIDADALEEGKFHSIENWTPIESASWQRGWNDALKSVEQFAPTVDAVPLEDYKSMERTVDKLTKALADAEPRRHGHWEVVDETEPRRYGCSVCKRLSWTEDNYCSYCGCKMDEVKDETN